MNNEQKLVQIKRYFEAEECNYECHLITIVDQVCFTKYDSYINDYLKVNKIYRNYNLDKELLVVDLEELYNCLLPALRQQKIDNIISE